MKSVFKITIFFNNSSSKYVAIKKKKKIWVKLITIKFSKGKQLFDTPIDIIHLYGSEYLPHIFYKKIVKLMTIFTHCEHAI